MGKCDSKSYLLFILSRMNCLDETKSSIEDHSGGWTQYEKSFAVRRTLCLRQYYLDQVEGLISATMLQHRGTPKSLQQRYQKVFI